MNTSSKSPPVDEKGKGTKVIIHKIEMVSIC